MEGGELGAWGAAPECGRPFIGLMTGGEVAGGGERPVALLFKASRLEVIGYWEGEARVSLFDGGNGRGGNAVLLEVLGGGRK
jgi:hypothetical protein